MKEALMNAKTVSMVIVILVVVTSVAIVLRSGKQMKSVETVPVIPSGAVAPVGQAERPVESPHLPAQSSASNQAMPVAPVVGTDQRPAPVESRDVPPAPPVVAAVPPQAGSTVVAESAIARFKDTSIPLETRRKEVASLAKKGDTTSLQTLMALGNAHVYLSWAAVEELGAFSGQSDKPVVDAYLKEKLSSDDSQVMCAAIHGYLMLMGVDAVPVLAGLFDLNRERPDGYQEIVCTALVKALEQTGSESAVPTLIAELKMADKANWSLEYGSSVVKAIGRLKTDEGLAALLAYADTLESRKPEDKMARAYFEEKIKEARSLAGK
jgi:hypothetical protein